MFKEIIKALIVAVGFASPLILFVIFLEMHEREMKQLKKD